MVTRLGDGSQGLDELVVVCMGADEIPHGRIACADTDSSPVESDAGRENRLGRVDLLELKTRVPRVTRPGVVCLECQLLGLGRTSERSFRNRLVVREITLQIHGLSLPSLELAKRLVGQGGKLVLRGGEGVCPAPLGIEFSE